MSVVAGPGGSAEKNKKRPWKELPHEALELVFDYGMSVTIIISGCVINNGICLLIFHGFGSCLRRFNAPILLLFQLHIALPNSKTTEHRIIDGSNIPVSDMALPLGTRSY